MDTPAKLPLLDATELRVLGSLMEKARTTPEYYPMSLNGLTAACNQKSSRKPVVSYDEQTVAIALDSLRKRGLVSTATGAGSRAVKYKHNFAIVFPLVPAEVAVICLLILRGPLTPGEVNTNSNRLYDFESIEEVQQILEKLATDELAYVLQLPRRQGQKEARYAHLLGGVPEINDDEPDAPIVQHSSGLEARVTKLETELAELREAFDKLMKELM
ncbi:YceH family protein [Mucilaginibacter myungsuensis]|uniref:YceH family protein n=1 Tax=Mucilaginibacter myungsuensis TaxID=649104 RepID=A0A929PYB2_9SPHI|nr:YceH family protein [Mucilaginibacter myungsuensis]MBE9664056.1 YceH family protein [Mucilaginibacter myungsuensis]MDN3601234.1 YceH family protein [Mucilaginibacter myungsuensis]